MRLKLIYILTFNFIFSIGLDALDIPKSSTHFISGKSTNLDLLQLDELFGKDSFLEYHSLFWFPGITGHSIHWKNGNGILKYISFNSIADDKVFYHGDVPSDEDNFQLPASLYSNSIVFGKSFNGVMTAFEINTFLSQLYTEKIFGALCNIYFFKNINNKLSIESSIKNIGILKGDNKNQNLPVQINLNANKELDFFPLNLGFGLNYQSKSLNPYSFVNYKNSILEITSSISKHENDKLIFASGISLNYKNYILGYSLSSPILESVKFPQLISFSYNF